MIVGLLVAVVATVLNCVAGLLQSDATRHVTPRRPLPTQPRYVLGLVADGLGWVATVVALQTLPVFLVQAVLAGSIALTPIGTRLLYGTPVRPSDRWGGLVCVLGLALVAASAGGDRPEAVAPGAVIGLGVAALLLVIAVVALWHTGRGWTLGIVAGLGFGATSLAVRALHVDPDAVIGSLLAQPETYLLVVFWAVGMTAWSRALELTPLARLIAIMLVTEVVAPGAVGIALLGDTVRAGWWVPMGVGLAAALAGVVVVARSPAIDPPPATVRHRGG